ncbi:hypothetical protein TrLO_g890 [Triparma laevis f. longispina]|uniref:Uncharacterized protein n=1 Tax=Triparma laevis f. longispina TaxID=1714387 RepID=A0A9W7A0I6_9STRA|nr:hypothetical protein TrLO_g890 [Triparma laevis f. longispina]
MRRPILPPTAEQKRHDLVGSNPNPTLSRPSSQSSFGVVTNATSNLLKSLGVKGPAPPNTNPSSGIQALLDGTGPSNLAGPTVVSYEDDGNTRVGKPMMKKKKKTTTLKSKPRFNGSKHPTKPKQKNTNGSPARRWKPKREGNNPYDDELGGQGDRVSAVGIPGLGGGNQQEEEQEIYYPSGPQSLQQPKLEAGDPNDDPDYQDYKIFKEQTMRTNEDRELEMMQELRRKAEEIESRAQISREQQQMQQRMQQQNMNIPGLGGPPAQPMNIPGLGHSAQPMNIPGLGGPPQQMQIPGLQSSQMPQMPHMPQMPQMPAPVDDLEFQEFKLFKQQEALRKQREERERMQRQLEQQTVQMGNGNPNMNMNVNNSMSMNPYGNNSNPANPYNYESENNTLGHSQSFGNGFQQNNFSDPNTGHRSHYDHNHNVESNPNVGGYNQQNNFSDPNQGHRSHYDHNHNAESNLNVGGYNQQNNFSDSNQGHRSHLGSHFNKNHNVDSSTSNFSSQPGHAPSPERKTFGIKSFFTNPKSVDGLEGQPPPMTLTSPVPTNNTSGVTYHSPSPGGKTKHMQALSLMNGPSLDERNGKLQKEMEYRNLLKQQMQEVEARKNKEKNEKKERQERELAELMEFETHSAKKISKDKKVLAHGEFGGQSAKAMLYGGDGSPQRKSPRKSPKKSPRESPSRSPRHEQNFQQQLDSNPMPNFASTHDPSGGADVRLPPDLNSSVRSDGGGGRGGFAALLAAKSGVEGGGAGGGGIPGLDGGGSNSNPYMDDDVPNNDDLQMQIKQMQNMQAQMPMDPRLAQKEQQIDQLSTMYADLMEEQRAMREALEAQQEEVKKVRDREKTLRAGQRGGARGEKKKLEGGLVRTQSARRQGDAAPGSDPYERRNDHYLSPGRKGKKSLRPKVKGKGTSSFAGPSEKKFPKGVNRFGFKESEKKRGGGGGGSGPPRDAGGRLIRKKEKRESPARVQQRNVYDDEDNYGGGGYGEGEDGGGGGGGGIPGLARERPARSSNNPYGDSGETNYNNNNASDPRQYSPRLEENHQVQELGGDSDLLYNDPSLDPAHGSIISADQLDRLMLKGLRQEK